MSLVGTFNVSLEEAVWDLGFTDVFPNWEGGAEALLYVIVADVGPNRW